MINKANYEMHKIKMYKNQVQIISGKQICFTIVHAQADKVQH